MGGLYRLLDEVVVVQGTSSKVPKKGELLGTVAFLGLRGQGYPEEFTEPKMSSHQNRARLVVPTRGGYLSTGIFGSRDPC